jgi:hypothetical protein
VGSEERDQEEKGEGGAHGWRDGAEKGKCFRQRTTVERYTALAPPESSAIAHSTDENPPAVRLTAVGRDGRVAEEVRRRRRRRGGAGRGQRACR